MNYQSRHVSCLSNCQASYCRRFLPPPATVQFCLQSAASRQWSVQTVGITAGCEEPKCATELVQTVGITTVCEEPKCATELVQTVGITAGCEEPKCATELV